MSDAETSDRDTYRTVAEPARASFAVRGSEFVGHVAPVGTVAAAESFVGDVRAEYDDATHNVPAYRVRADPFREYSSDDGEPSGSAGKPALNVLQGRGLENVTVVVTRYYDGTNLGVGGLARAYGRAVKEAIDAAGVVTDVPREPLRAVVDYDDSGTVRGILESTGVDFDADYAERVTFAARVPVADAPALRDRLQSATGGRIELAED